MTQIGTQTTARIHLLGQGDLSFMESMLTLFGEAFDQSVMYDSARPGREYYEMLLSNELFVPLVALNGESVVGGLVAYELMKFDQERSEFYIYDLAVAAEHRRTGIATALIEELREIAAARCASVIYVQADYGDEAAVALYTRLGERVDVMHFDIAVRRQ